MPDASATIVPEDVPLSATFAPAPAVPREPVMLNVWRVAVALNATFTDPLVASLVTVIVAVKGPATVASA